MPIVKIHKEHNIFESKVNSNVNLVVQVGVKKFPFPHLKYKCGNGDLWNVLCQNNFW